MRPPIPRSAWAWFFDVDGTLAPLASTPESAVVDGVILELISSLAEKSNGAVALISGRSIAQLDSLFPDIRLPAAGQHGAEHRGASGAVVHRAPDKSAMAKVRDAFLRIANAHANVLVEDKGLSIALHYRLAPELEPLLKQQVQAILGDLQNGVRLLQGKCVLEVVPDSVDKGVALIAFMDEPPFSERTAVFIGDDITDEQAFAVVNARDGISIKVGAGTSCAKYRLESVADVRNWLATLPELTRTPQLRTGGATL